MSMPRSEVEIVTEGGLLRTVKINGADIVVASMGVRWEMKNFPILTVEIPVIDLAWRGDIAVEIANGPNDPELVRDRDGRLWIVPKEAP